VAILSVGLFVAPALALDTPPPTPVPPRGSPSPFTTDLHTVENATKPPPLQAKEALLMDADTGQVLFARRADERQQIHRHQVHEIEQQDPAENGQRQRRDQRTGESNAGLFHNFLWFVCLS
jgi:hypothetical protein